MEHINPDTLDALITEAGLGKITAGKLRRANATPGDGGDAAAPAAPGHGAARPVVIQVNDL